MLDMIWIRDNLAKVETALRNRGERFDIDRFKKLDTDRRSALHEVE